MEKEQAPLPGSIPVPSATAHRLPSGGHVRYADLAAGRGGRGDPGPKRGAGGRDSCAPVKTCSGVGRGIYLMR